MTRARGAPPRPAPRLASLLCVAALVSCAAPGPTPAPPAASPPQPGAVVTWEGERTVSTLVEVPAGTTLRVLPGSVVRFAYVDADGDGVGDAGLHVRGRVEAAGAPGRPVVFTSAEREPQPGDWQGLLFDDSRGNRFSGVLVEYANHAFHAHFSAGEIVRSRLERNVEGTRLGNSRFEIAHNLVRANTSKGINFFACANRVHHNLVTGNADGIFLFETDTESVIEANNILGNERYDFRLGDFYRGGKTLRGNWWGTTDLAAIRARVFDGEDDPALGRLEIEPAPAPFVTGWE